MEALRAIEAKNVAGLDAVGEKLDAACESCHRTYWYPNAPEPTKVFDEKADLLRGLASYVVNRRA